MRTFCKVISASDLLGGHAIWRAAGGRWTDRHSEAELYEEPRAAEAALDEAEADPHVIGPYLADAKPGPGGPEPAHFREEFRVSGPSSGHSAGRP